MSSSEVWTWIGIRFGQTGRVQRLTVGKQAQVATFHFADPVAFEVLKELARRSHRLGDPAREGAGETFRALRTLGAVSDADQGRPATPTTLDELAQAAGLTRRKTHMALLRLCNRGLISVKQFARPAWGPAARAGLGGKMLVLFDPERIREVREGV